VKAHDDDFFENRKTSSNLGASEAEVQAVVQAAYAIGVRGPLLEEIRSAPIRSLAWLTYLKSQDSVDSIPRYLNTVILRPGSEFPPDFDKQRRWTIDSSGEIPVLVDAAQKEYAGEPRQTPVATIACIDQALQTLSDGVYLQDHPRYIELLEEAREVLACQESSGVRLQYRAHYRALQQWGLLEDYAEPFSTPVGPRAQHG